MRKPSIYPNLHKPRLRPAKLRQTLELQPLIRTSSIHPFVPLGVPVVVVGNSGSYIFLIPLRHQSRGCLVECVHCHCLKPRFENIFDTIFIINLLINLILSIDQFIDIDRPLPGVVRLLVADPHPAHVVAVHGRDPGVVVTNSSARVLGDHTLELLIRVTRPVGVANLEWFVMAKCAGVKLSVRVTLDLNSLPLSGWSQRIVGSIG